MPIFYRDWGMQEIGFLELNSLAQKNLQSNPNVLTLTIILLQDLSSIER